MKLTIRPLTRELIPHYLDFFDSRAFSDGNPNGPCYCTSPSQDEATVKQMVREFKANGVKETLRKYAVELLNEEKIHGYLAFDGDTSVGWCNADDIKSYLGFVPAFARQIACEKTMAVVCFEIAPSYRGMGIATAFLERICSDAKTRGYEAVEGYVKVQKDHAYDDYHGPRRLYEKVGFKEVARKNNQIVMRKVL